MADATCSTCGKALAQADVLYNTSGNIVCSECSDKAEIKGDEGRAAKNIKIAGITSAFLGVVGFLAFVIGFGLGFWPAAIGCVAAAAFAINGLYGPGAERFVAYLTPADKVITLVCTIIGIGLTAFELLAIGGVIKFHLWVRM